MRRLPPPWSLALLASVALAVLVLWPGIAMPTQALIGHPSIDVWAHVWGMHWFVTELVQGRFPWEVVGASWPETRVLWYIDPIGALLSAPLQLIHPALAWNGLLLAEIVALAFCGWGWGRSLGGRGWLAGAALATTPMIQAELWNGVSEAVWLAPVALAGWLAAHRSRWAGLAVGVSLAMTPYHGIGAALLVTALTLLGGAPSLEGPRPTWQRRVGDLVLAGAIALLVAAPFMWLLKEGVSSKLSFVNRPFLQGWNWPSLYSNAVDPRALVTPGQFWSVPFVESAQGISWRRTPYLGLGLLGLSVVGLVRVPRLWPLVLPLGVLVTATLGHFLFFDNGWVETAEGGKYQLPLGLVVEQLGIAMEHPMRFAGSAVVVLAGLADRAAGRWGLLLAPLIVFEHLQLAPHAWPISTSPAGLPAVHVGLEADGKAVIDLPADYGAGMHTDRYLYWETLHGRPVPWNNHVGSTGTASMNPALRTMALLSKRGPVVPGTPGVPAADADLPAALDELVDQGLGWVVVHPWMFRSDPVALKHREALTDLMGPPTQDSRDAWVWRLPPAD